MSVLHGPAVIVIVIVIVCSNVAIGSALQFQNYNGAEVDETDKTTIKISSIVANNTNEDIPIISSVVDEESRPSVALSEHTITSVDFAEKTAFINAKKDNNKDSEIHNTENKDDAKSSLLSDHLIESTPETNSNMTSVDHEDRGLQRQEPATLDEFTNRICNELKVYSNEVALAWSEKNVKVSWTGEAANVLKDYRDKISISQAARNAECVKKDLENYEDRMKRLNNAIKSCEDNLKREDWKRLQEVTKSILTKIYDILQDTKNKIASNNIKTAELENNAKEKIQLLNIESIKEELLKLKEKSLTTDEEDYKKCLDENPNKAMVVDTLNDIMRIKNNCVG